MWYYDLSMVLCFGGCYTTKLLNFDLKEVGERILLQLNELDEFKQETYENIKLYEEKIKKWHDKNIMRRDFHIG